MKLLLMLLILGLLQACVKDEGKVPAAGVVDGNSGGSSGGSGSSGEDPLAEYAWHLNNTGQSTFADFGGIAGEDIDLEEAMALGYRGTGIKVAVSDSGVDLFHEDLAGNELAGEHRNYSFSDSSKWRDASPYPSDGVSHGTAVAGLVAALGWNDLGSRGVAPEAKWAAFRYIFDYPASTTDVSMTARGLDQMDGDFDIFNYSYGKVQYYFFEENADEIEGYKVGVSELRDGKGAIYVQSAGNSYTDLACTAYDINDNCTTWTPYAGNANTDPDRATPHKIIVGAVNASGVKSSYSTPGSGIWASAPGGEYGSALPAMLTTDISSCSSGYSMKVLSGTAFDDGNLSVNRNCDYTSTMNGTSSAAPVASGVIALMLEANPDLTWRDVKHILAVTSTQIDYDPFFNDITHPLGEDMPGYVYDQKWITDSIGLPYNAAGFAFSNWYGFGRIDADAAVSMAESYGLDLGVYETTANPNTDVWYYGSGPLVGLTMNDGDGTYVSNGISVDHNFTVEAIQVRLTTTHTSPSDLAVHLISPSGTESRLININSGVHNTSLEPDQLLLTNAFYGEQAGGTWILRVYDGKTNTVVGDLTEWKINIHGRRPPGDGAAPSPASAVSMALTFGSTTISPPISFTHSPSINVERYEVAVGSTFGGTDLADWYSIGYTDTFQVLSLSGLLDGRTYYVQVRAIDTEEDISSVAHGSWVVDI